MSQPFEYAKVPLERPKEQIRLLRCPPQESASGPIRCQLHVFDLENAPAYHALSYAWGQPNRTVPVLCNDDDHCLMITPSLKEVLARFAWDQYCDSELLEAAQLSMINSGEEWCDGPGILRYDNPPRWFREDTRKMGSDVSAWALAAMASPWLWVDQICINQADKTEKSAQVRLMRRIYEQATYTLIWLGPNSNESFAFGYYIYARKQMAAAYEQAGETRREDRLNMIDTFKYQWHVLDNEMDELANQFIAKGWFTRTWVAQELAVSRKPVFMLDRQYLRWADVKEALEFAIQFRNDHKMDPNRLAWFVALRNSVEAKENGYLDVLIREGHRLLGCYNRKDHIYALLGLAEDDLEIQPDYNLTTEMVYLHCTMKMMAASTQLIFFDLGRSRDRIEGKPPNESSSLVRDAHPLPSWVPDWRYEDRLSPVYMWNEFAAAPPRSDSLTMSSDGHRKLTLSGYFVNRIDDIDTDADLRAFSVLQLISIYRLFRAQSTEPYELTGESRRDAFFKTLSAGSIEFSNRFDTIEQMMRFWDQWEATIIRPLSFLTWCRCPSFGFKHAEHILRWLVHLILCLWYWNRIDCFAFDIWPYAIGRWMFRTEYGYIGLAPEVAEAGDLVYVVKGANAPLVLRKIRKSGDLILLGDCYLHGFMDGDKFKEKKCEDFWLS